MDDPSLERGEGLSEALADALRRLKKAERTAAELRKALLPRYPADDVEAALTWLLARKLLSEERAVEATVWPRISGRRAEGNARLRDRLQARGATPEAIESALADTPSEAERIQEALSAKFKSEDSSSRGKAGRFLVARGFDEDAIEGALDRFFGDG